ncbi:MAG: MgtE intracellular region [Synergistaceae bacterium]|nr:MgtE intracellular region [Synergistota bacterium]NLM70844.1 MgtE intracellular region [Synergistaceae bacterium]
MPEEREDIEREGREEAEAPLPQAKKKVKAKKKKKKTGKLGILLLALAVLAGVGAGMHFAGTWDARPYVYEIVPRIPWVGKRLAGFAGIPEEYTLTVEQRRKLELERWNQRLDELERELIEKEALLEGLSDELDARAEALDRREAEFAQRDDAPPESTEDEQEYLDMLMKTYQEISPRRAALILEQVSEDLAVRMLAAMPQDARASILGRMEAVLAARLTERLAAGAP